MSESKQDLVDVRIEKDNHSHAGVAIPKGSTIAVSEETAVWLVKEQIGTRSTMGRVSPKSTPQ